MTFQRTEFFSPEQRTQAKRNFCCWLQLSKFIKQRKHSTHAPYHAHTRKFNKLDVETRNSDEILSGSSCNYEVLFPVFAPESGGGKGGKRRKLALPDLLFQQTHTEDQMRGSSGLQERRTDCRCVHTTALYRPGRAFCCALSTYSSAQTLKHSISIC